MAGFYCLGAFHTVCPDGTARHGTSQTEEVVGNGIDPLAVAPNFGADALRHAGDGTRRRRDVNLNMTSKIARPEEPRRSSGTSASASADAGRRRAGERSVNYRTSVLISQRRLDHRYASETPCRMPMPRSPCTPVDRNSGFRRNARRGDQARRVFRNRSLWERRTRRIGMSRQACAAV